MNEAIRNAIIKIAKDRAVNIEMKQRSNPTLSVFENANKSYIKGAEKAADIYEADIQALRNNNKELGEQRFILMEKLASYEAEMQRLVEELKKITGITLLDPTVNGQWEFCQRTARQALEDHSKWKKGEV